MKKIIAGFLLISSFAVCAWATPISYTQLNPTAQQTGGFNVNTGTITYATITNAAIGSGIIGWGVGGAPQSPLDFECNGTEGLDCVYVKGANGIIPLEVYSTSDNPVISAHSGYTGTPTSGNEWAAALYASNAAAGSNGSVAALFQTNGSTAIYVTAPGNSAAIKVASGISQFQQASVSGYLQLYSQTKAQIAAITPTSNAGVVVGEEYYCSDCATVAVCISTGSAQGAFSLITNKASACQ